MQGFTWKLDDLPPHLKEQALRQLGRGPVERSSPVPPKPIHPKAADAPQALQTRNAANRRRMSHTEERFQNRFCPANGWSVICYEPCSIWISGGFRYTPDFMIELPDGRLAFVETKGSFRLQSHSRARLAFADACRRTPGFLFIWAKETRKHDGFNLEWWQSGKAIKHAEIPSKRTPESLTKGTKSNFSASENR